MATKYFQVRLEPSDFEALKARWQQAGFASQQEAGLHALLNAFRQDCTLDAEVPERFRHYIPKFNEILSSKNESAITALTSIADVLLEHVRRG